MSKSSLSYPRGNRLAQSFWKACFFLTGWKVEGKYPDHPKSVLIFAPHTSNWDFIFILMTLYAAGIKPNWLGKKELFFWPAKYIFKALGGFPVDRSKSLSTVKATLKLFQDRDQALLGVSPEGTRSRSNYWKTGFYHIAHKANVPINFCYLNFRDKIGGFHEGFMPTGDIDKDMEIIRDFYNERLSLAKYPHEVGEIKIKNNRNSQKN